MNKINGSVLLAALLLIGTSSAFARGGESPSPQAPETSATQDRIPGYVCQAGVSISKHNFSVLGDVSTSREEAANSALEKCKNETVFGSAWSYYCRSQMCYAEEIPSGD